MATKVHPTAIVDGDCELGEGVEVGPFCVIEGGVSLGDDSIVESHAVLKRGTHLGVNCRVCPQVVLGHLPQDGKFRGEESFLIIGDNNTFREGVTVHRATGEGQRTVVGDDNMFMAYSHIAHNCQIGSGLMVANYVGISGHVVIEDRVVIGGMAGFHQFVRVGKLAMIGGYSKISQDVPPFMLAEGRPAKVAGLNVVGLRRAGVDRDTRNDLRRAIHLLCRSGLNTSQAIERIEAELRMTPEMRYLLDFIKAIPEGRAGRQLEKAH